MSKTQEIPLGVVNGIQLNIVTTIDYKSIMRSGYKSLNNAVFLTDNSFESTGKGTPDLETVCTQGQVLNWLMFPINIDEFHNPYVYSPTIRISNIVFLQDNGEVYREKICENLHSYGSLEKGRPYLCPPVFFYWAGSVRVNLPPGRYRYRLIYEIDDYTSPAQKYYLNLDSTSLCVVPLQKS
ncbi:MAG: hypothetical protein AAF611_08935 [Bacteroidota bacterium]